MNRFKILRITIIIRFPVYEIKDSLLDIRTLNIFYDVCPKSGVGRLLSPRFYEREGQGWVSFGQICFTKDQYYIDKMPTKEVLEICWMA